MRQNIEAVSIAIEDLSQSLLCVSEVLTHEAPGQSEAAVLVPIYVSGDDLTIVLTKRRANLRRHAGEISFPGGRPSSEENDLRHTALREAEEEIGLAPEHVELIGALTPTSTFVTNYAIYPFVGMLRGELAFTPSPEEVEAVLELSTSQLIDGHERRRLIRRGVPVKTDTYTVGEDLIWGATARMLTDLLRRFQPVIGNPRV